MPATRVTVTSAEQRGEKYYVRFDDGFELEFTNIRKMRQFVRQYREEAKEFLRAIAIAKYLESDPNAVAPSAIVGKVLTVDLSLARNIVQVT